MKHSFLDKMQSLMDWLNKRIPELRDLSFDNTLAGINLHLAWIIHDFYRSA